MRLFVVLFSTLLILGCQSSDPLSAKNDPKDQWWSLDFISPSYMPGLVEHSAVEDIQGKTFQRRGGGAVGTGAPGDTTEIAKGWNKVGGNVIPVVGADLPKRIFVRWQSAVDQKTYRAWVDIPQSAREIMSASTNSRCTETPEKPARYIASVILGLAPGGVVQAWVRDSCHDAIKVARAQAEVEPLGPFLGKSDGKYYPQSDASKRYIEKYGIPYGSW
ncbi:hypothetical protein BK666_07210 [Pseudomonas frederiksbergensis]|uniref:DUF2931 domain-containing protein n=1 Tax=Pseudomonas frederiksbergensis TaxID=104087 RepID=A0A423KBD7_9PSED|nr:DUF2931 family protein [Pseudomonas frederiksbergensis]RON49356.1 hypothetical protein BK666_07210 [Pseudomonas frederiksbergensis]